MAPQESFVVSFDIGMLNLAICIVKIEHPHRYVTIEDWDLLNLGSKKGEECSRECIRLLKSSLKPSVNIPDNKNIWVIIERQSPRNHQCLCISHSIFGFFLSTFNNINVQFVSSSAKPLKEKGQKRKTESVRETKKWLEQNRQDNTAIIEWFKKQKKKDDICDAFLQALVFADKIPYYEQMPVKHEVIVISDSDDE